MVVSDAALLRELRPRPAVRAEMEDAAATAALSRASFPRAMIARVLDIDPKTVDARITRWEQMRAAYASERLEGST